MLLPSNRLLRACNWLPVLACSAFAVAATAPATAANASVSVAATPATTASPEAARQPASLPTALVRASTTASAYQADGVVEAVRQSVLASQVSGVITLLPVKAGDAVQKGQLLARIDARAANQDAAASQAQVAAAQAALQVARRDHERQQQLFAQRFISQASLDQAHSRLQEAEAQARATSALAGAQQTRSGFYEITAPFAGLLAEVAVTQGDMAMPGRALMTLFDPTAMRVSVAVPQTRASALVPGQPVGIEIAALPAPLQATGVTVLPMADATTHTVQLRLDLPASASKPGGLRPGQFARASLPQTASLDGMRLYVPLSALFRRAELWAVYVQDAQGRPQLRLVRPGPVLGAEREILSGLRAGERVVLEPLAAARQAVGARHE